MMTRLSQLCLVAAITCLANRPALAQKDVFVNARPSYFVTVNVDHPDRVYREGDKLRMTVSSERSGYLYVFYINSAGKEYLVFPNEFQQENYIQAKQLTTIPRPDSNFDFVVRGPNFGREYIKALVSPHKLERLEQSQPRGKSVTPLDEGTMMKSARDLGVEERQNPGGQANSTPLVAMRPGVGEHHVEILTMPAGERRQSQPRRVAVVIALPEFKNRGVSSLPACRNDAKVMEQLLKEKGNFDEVKTLVGSEATIANVRDAIVRWLPSRTEPGDVALVYWTGHGGTISDVDGDDKDGVDEYLIPYDFDPSTPASLRSTIVLDDDFGRWIQGLSGRQVAVILDACHAGGQITNHKGTKGFSGDQPFFGKLFPRIGQKDIGDHGQKDLAVYASSTAGQTSWVHNEKPISVFTDFLGNYWRNDARPSLKKSVTPVSKNVRDYVKNTYNEEQLPVLQFFGMEDLPLN